MKKEVILAIIAGLTLGLIITAGIYTANRSINTQRAKKQLQALPTPSILPTAVNNKTISLTAPEPNDLFNEAETVISGIAWPNAVVALITETDVQMAAADNEGIFSFTTTLIKGFNEITIIASDETGLTQNQNFILTYSTALIELGAINLVSPVYAAEASEAATTITEKIKERLQDTAGEEIVSIKESLTEKNREPRKKAYIGQISVLDQTSLTLTYKNQIYNVNLLQDTKYYKGTNNPLAAADLKINDFVIAMGFYLPESNSFEAHRISVVSKPETTAAKQLITGKISELDGQKISLNGKTITLGAKTDLAVKGINTATVDDLVLGDNLFAIVTLDNNGDIDTVNNVFIQPGKDNPAGLVPTNINATNSAAASPSADNAE